MYIKTRAIVALFIFLWLATATSACAAENHEAVIGKVLEHYFAIKEKLAGDSLRGVATEAQGMLVQVQILAELQPDMTTDRLHELQDIAGQIGKHARNLSSRDIREVREHFSSLSRTLVRYVVTFELKDDGLYILYCDMGKRSWLSEDGETNSPDYGAIWLQDDKNIGNPYYGAEMLSCGRIINDAEN